ncbi:MAG: TIGR00730 family Rossman fold protein [Rhodospirillales bacterium]
MTDNSRQKAAASYRLAMDDTAFLLRDEMRDIRFALEYSKAELGLRDWGIRSAIIVFGSARTAAGTPRYEAARAFARIAAAQGGAMAPHHRWRDNVIATGGGGGIMEAANRGAFEAGAPSIGFNIRLPSEQEPNAFSTPELTFQFHYFAMRKMHMAMRASALVVFPGGFGTMDELFELLTLVQTGKMRSVPIVLFEEAYWRKVLSFETLVAEGMIGAEELALFEFAETPEAIWDVLVRRGVKPTENG